MRQTRTGRIKRNQVLAAQEDTAAKIAAGVIDGVDYAGLRRNAAQTSYSGPTQGDKRVLIEPYSGNAQDDAARMRILSELGYQVESGENTITATIPQAGHEAQVADQHDQYLTKRHFNRDIEAKLNISNRIGGGKLTTEGFEDSEVPISAADFTGEYEQVD
jgi:hypothetical protein